jgi:simple sugar transport system ATP-binding protein
MPPAVQEAGQPVSCTLFSHHDMNIDLTDIHKHFGPVSANDGVSLSVAAGTIHGVLGENGAGKSTLMKILAGIQRPDSGRLQLDGKPAVFDTPRAACSARNRWIFRR